MQKCNSPADDALKLQRNDRDAGRTRKREEEHEGGRGRRKKEEVIKKWALDRNRYYSFLSREIGWDKEGGASMHFDF